MYLVGGGDAFVLNTTNGPPFRLGLAFGVGSGRLLTLNLPAFGSSSRLLPAFCSSSRLLGLSQNCLRSGDRLPGLG